MTDNEVWEEVRKFYIEKFGISPELVDIAPILDLLRLCASGSSNKSIAKFFDETEEGLMELFDAHLGFMGWDIDMKFSPLKLYKELDDKSLESFKDAVVTKYGYHHPWFIERLYKTASFVDKLERLFDEKWI